MERICGTSSFEGKDPVFTIVDIVYHPDIYDKANLIKIRNVPLREAFRTVATIPVDEQNRIIKDGTVSLELLNNPQVKAMLAEVAAHDNRKAGAIREIEDARRELESLCFSVLAGGERFFPASIVPPATTSTDTSWHHLFELEGNDPDVVAEAKAEHVSLSPALPGYTADQARQLLKADGDFNVAWRDRDAARVNTASAKIADALAKINPAVYPSETIRNVEVIYNRLAKMTFPGAAFYFFAFVCFLISAVVGLNNLRLWGLRLLVLGFIIHSSGIAVRWWLTGSWLPPIKNEFESVMFSAWFGVLVGLLYELGFFPALRRLLAKIWPAGDKNRPAKIKARTGPAGYGILGAAASFVGMMSLLAIFAVPYVFHISIGENVGQVNGVLMSYWLFVHVMMVTASYSMIGMAFLLGSWWLITYYGNYRTLSRVSGRQLEGSGHGFEPLFPAGSGTAALSFSATLARMIFFPVATADAPTKNARAVEAELPQNTVSFLATLDACNLVVLQLAFWTLGIGIVLGAIWADQSWGRFWAWDPKETFALVTWIAYLIIVHVRVATQDKAWWTGVLSIFGFFLMLFNWIGVNYFLPGLHSYAG